MPIQSDAAAFLLVCVDECSTGYKTTRCLA